MIQKQSIIYLSHYGSKGYAAVVLEDSGGNFLGEEEYASISLLCSGYIQHYSIEAVSPSLDCVLLFIVSISLLCPSGYCVLVIHSITVSKQLVINFPCLLWGLKVFSVEIPTLLYFWGHFIKTSSFSIFNFC